VSIIHPIWVPCLRQWIIFLTTLVWLWAGDKISIVQSGALLKTLATSPEMSRTIRSHAKTEMSGMVDRSPNVQRNSVNPRATFDRFSCALIVATNSLWTALYFPLGIGFWMISPAIYSLPGLVSGISKKASNEMGILWILGRDWTIGRSPAMSVNIYHIVDLKHRGSWFTRYSDALTISIIRCFSILVSKSISTA